MYTHGPCAYTRIYIPADSSTAFSSRERPPRRSPDARRGGGAAARARSSPLKAAAAPAGWMRGAGAGGTPGPAAGALRR